MNRTLKLGTVSMYVEITIEDTEDEDEAVPSLSLHELPGWLYTPEARRLGHALIKLADAADERAKKRTAVLKRKKKANARTRRSHTKNR